MPWQGCNALKSKADPAGELSCGAGKRLYKPGVESG